MSIHASRRSQARGLTDAAGRFRLPAASVRRRILWFTMMESLGAAWYWLCAGAADSTRGPIPLRRVEIDGYVRGDTVSCLTWVWQSEHRLTCNAPRVQRIFTDGDWTDGRTSGFYRAILAEDARGGYEARAFVQWIEPRVGGRAAVRAIAELPTSEDVVSDRGVRFGIRDGRWYAAVISVKRTTWGNERQLTFELGPPGQVRRLPER